MLKHLILIGAFTLLTVLAWIGFDVYHNSVTSTVSEDTVKTIIPITPTFDQEAILLLQKRQQIGVDLAGGPQVATGTARQATPTPTSIQVTPQTTATPSAQQTPRL
jgi:hypothetical protein